MNIIVCVDDNQGMLFNRRRQSKDSKVLEDIATLTKQLWMSPFSEKLFSEAQMMIENDTDFLSKAGEGDFCFVEKERLMPYEHKLEQIILYRWNRKYPSDFKLDLELSEWKLMETFEFAGSSHEKITREIYKKN